MQIYLISYLVSICFWIWIILKYDKFEREPLKSVLYVFVIGGLISSLPAGLFNTLFSGLIDYQFAPGYRMNMGVEKSALFFAFVGFNEEFFKAVATIFLIRKMKDFNEPADALVYAMSVAFGFSVFENIEYTLNLGLTAFYIRQFNAVPLHIGLAAIWGTGIAKARFLHQGKYWITMLPYILVAAFLHFIYNFSPNLLPDPILSLLLSSIISFFLIRFAIRKLKRYSEDGPYSNLLYCRHCHTSNSVYASVCKNCGKKFQLEFYVICESCREKVDRQASICPNCGAGLANEHSC